MINFLFYNLAICRYLSEKRGKAAFANVKRMTYESLVVHLSRKQQKLAFLRKKEARFQLMISFVGANVPLFFSVAWWTRVNGRRSKSRTGVLKHSIPVRFTLEKQWSRKQLRELPLFIRVATGNYALSFARLRFYLSPSLTALLKILI